MQNRVIVILAEGVTREEVASRINFSEFLKNKVSVITSVVDGKLRLFLHKVDVADPQEAFEIMKGIVAYLSTQHLLDKHNLDMELIV